MPSTPDHPKSAPTEMTWNDVLAKKESPVPHFEDDSKDEPSSSRTQSAASEAPVVTSEDAPKTPNAMSMIVDDLVIPDAPSGSSSASASSLPPVSKEATPPKPSAPKASEPAPAKLEHFDANHNGFEGAPTRTRTLDKGELDYIRAVLNSQDAPAPPAAPSQATSADALSAPAGLSEPSATEEEPKTEVEVRPKKTHASVVARITTIAVPVDSFSEEPTAVGRVDTKDERPVARARADTLDPSLNELDRAWRVAEKLKLPDLERPKPPSDDALVALPPSSPPKLTPLEAPEAAGEPNLPELSISALRELPEDELPLIEDEEELEQPNVVRTAPQTSTQTAPEIEEADELESLDELELIEISDPIEAQPLDVPQPEAPQPLDAQSPAATEPRTLEVRSLGVAAEPTPLTPDEDALEVISIPDPIKLSAFDVVTYHGPAGEPDPPDPLEDSTQAETDQIDQPDQLAEPKEIEAPFIGIIQAEEISLVEPFAAKAPMESHSVPSPPLDDEDEPLQIDAPAPLTAPAAPTAPTAPTAESAPRVIVGKPLQPAPRAPSAPANVQMDVEGILASALGMEHEGPVPIAAPRAPSQAPEQPPPLPSQRPAPNQVHSFEALEAKSEEAFELDELPGTPRVMQVPERGPKSELILGIDLGTTYSCAAIIENGSARMFTSRFGPPTLPSVVTFGARTLVGDTALRALPGAPRATIVSSKRLMGRRYSSEIVQQVKGHFAYRVVPGVEGEAAVRVGQEIISLEEVAAHVLEELRISASQQHGTRLNRAVITCPAYFTERQRNAVRKAGELAGFYVERVLNEPTAAALHYGQQEPLSSRTILIYDLGGGTFDVSLLKVDGDNFEVLATGGDTFLGGIDFDACLTEMLCNEMRAQHNIDPRQDSGAVAKLMQYAEQAKRALSEEERTTVHIEHLVVQPYAARSLTCELSRAAVEDAWTALVNQTLAIVKDVCDRGKLMLEQVDEVLLVGGQTRTPMIRANVRALFGREPKALPNPDEAVALGAARFADSLISSAPLELTDVLPMSLGVCLPGGRFRKVISRDTPLPTRKTSKLRTSKKNKSRFEVFIFQGESDNIEENEPIGSLMLTGLPKASKAGLVINVQIDVSVDSVLSVTLTEPSSKRQISAQLGTSNTPEELRLKLGLPPQPTHKDIAKRKGQIGRPKGVWGWLSGVFGR